MSEMLKANSTVHKIVLSSNIIDDEALVVLADGLGPYGPTRPIRRPTHPPRRQTSWLCKRVCWFHCVWFVFPKFHCKPVSNVVADLGNATEEHALEA